MRRAGWGPGMWLAYYETLASARAVPDPLRISQVWDRARCRYGADAHALAAVFWDEVQGGAWHIHEDWRASLGCTRVAPGASRRDG